MEAIHLTVGILVVAASLLILDLGSPMARALTVPATEVLLLPLIVTDTMTCVLATPRHQWTTAIRQEAAITDAEMRTMIGATMIAVDSGV